MRDSYLIFTLAFDNFFLHATPGIQRKTNFVLITWFITEYAGGLIFLTTFLFSGQSWNHHNASDMFFILLSYI